MTLFFVQAPAHVTAVLFLSEQILI